MTTTPPDLAVERRVDALIAQGCRLSRWGWPTPGPYNGATGQERIRGWQKLNLACRRDWIPWPHTCSVCGLASGLHYHSENYFRPLLVQPICRSCHYRVHRRFSEPSRWLAFLSGHENVSWIAMIAMEQLTRAQAITLAARRNPTDARQVRGRIDGGSDVSRRKGEGA